MDMRHPKNSDALTRSQVSAGKRFRCIELNNPESERTGVFKSDAYQQTRGEYVVDIQYDDEHSPHTVELRTLGIMSKSNGTWGNSVTVPYVE